MVVVEVEVRKSFQDLFYRDVHKGLPMVWIWEGHGYGGGRGHKGPLGFGLG